VAVIFIGGVMNGFAESVVEFNETLLGIQRPTKPQCLSPEMFEHLANCLNEELDEFTDAHYVENLVGAVDALIDLMYFAVGGLHKMGLTPDQMTRIGQVVHHANMKKRQGVIERRGDGSVPDATKPTDWVAPEQLILQILKEE